MYKITKEFHFESAHILDGHKGLCVNLHGHSYRLLVSVSAFDCTDGMILDFSDLKKTVDECLISKIDHAFFYNTNTKDGAETEIAGVLQKHGRRVYSLNCRPTAENMCKHFFDILAPQLSSNSYHLDKITLFETSSSFCEYSKSDAGSK